MAGARREFEGALTAWLISCIPPAIWKPDALPQGAALNPFAQPVEESEAMQRHKAAWARAFFRGAVQASQQKD